MFRKLITKIFRRKKKSYFKNDIFSFNEKLNGNPLKFWTERLIKSDIAIEDVKHIMNDISEKAQNENDFEIVKNLLEEKLLEILKPATGKLEITKKPYVILFNGVNGAGKTSSISKLANFFVNIQNKKLVIAACDTFRAAATKQLADFIKNIDCKLITAEKENGDPAAVAYKAIDYAERENADIVMIDTAGRLQNNTNLMEQLEKIIRVMKKKNAEYPHLSLIVTDANSGQNSLKQFEIFSKYCNIDGMVLTKIDGTAKAGAIISIIKKFPDKFKLYFFTNGEKITDIHQFDAKEFIKKFLY